jgi:glucose-1-phosphate adenylyltransferase
MRDTSTLILAGGRGKRMDIFCHQRPKPTLPFAGNFRVIDFTLSNCVYSQLENIGILVDYQRSSMTEYINKWSNANDKTKGISVLQPQYGSYSGTSDAVYQNLNYIRKEKSDRVLILAGDHIYKMDYHKMLDFHQLVNADVTVGVVRVPIKQANRFGTLEVNSEGKIKAFVEKSSNPKTNMASMGIYIFNSDILEKRLAEDAMIKDSPHDFGYAILPKIVDQDKVFAYEFNDYWQDIGTVEAYYEASMELLRMDSSFKLDGDWPVLTCSGISPISIKNEGGRIINSIISPGCVVKGYVKNSILSPGVFVGEYAEVVNSVIMDNTSIGYHTVVDSCILDEGVNIGNFCYLGFGAHTQTGVWDITLLGKEVSVPSKTAIGRKCKVLPGLKMKGFGSGLITSGTVLSAVT